LFFAATLALMLLKRYGSPLINWIGGLPLSDMVVYPKYLEPPDRAMCRDAGRSGLCGACRAACRLAVVCFGRGPFVLAFMLGAAGWYLPEVLRLKLKLAKASMSSPSDGRQPAAGHNWIRLVRPEKLRRKSVPGCCAGSSDFSRWNCSSTSFCRASICSARFLRPRPIRTRVLPTSVSSVG